MCSSSRNIPIFAQSLVRLDVNKLVGCILWERCAASRWYLFATGGCSRPGWWLRGRRRLGRQCHGVVDRIEVSSVWWFSVVRRAREGRGRAAACIHLWPARGASAAQGRCAAWRSPVTWRGGCTPLTSGPRRPCRPYRVLFTVAHTSAMCIRKPFIYIF